MVSVQSKKIAAMVATTAASVLLALTVTGCASAAGAASVSEAPGSGSIEVVSDVKASTGDYPSTQVNAVAGSLIDGNELFTERDLAQAVDTTDATVLTLASGQDITITQEGVYVVSGSASDATIIVNADSSAKVQIVLDSVSISNSGAPAVYVQSADKVFVTLSGSSAIAVSGEIAVDGDTSVDAAVFSKDDLVFNGTGSLTIESSGNAITSKDDLKVTGGSYAVSCEGHAFEANDEIAIADGSFAIASGKDAFNCTNDEDGTLGYVYVCGGTFDIDSQSDGIHASSVAQIDGGTFTISASEGIEATYVQVNGGDTSIEASDDGINATYISGEYTPTLEITGGSLSVTMAAGDTDALDSNGNLYISGGTVDITAQSAFDFDGQVSFTGGTVTVNGEKVTQITNSMMMGGQMAGGQMMGGATGAGMQGQGAR